MAKKTTVLIIDDHPLFRAGVKSVFKDNPDFDVVGEASDGDDGVRSAARLFPDIVIADLAVLESDGFDIASKLRKSSPETALIIMTMHPRIDHIIESFKVGAVGFVIKDSPLCMLEQALFSVSNGAFFIDPAVSGIVVRELLKEPEDSRRLDAETELTNREREILVMLARGGKPRQIALELCISPKTVENHRYNIMKKLKIHSSNDLVKYALKSGLIDVESWF